MTEEQTSLPPPFIVGEMYEDEIGKYKVLSVEGTHMTFERLDGTQNHTENIPLKASIHKRRVSERQHPRPLNYQQSKTGSETTEYTYEIVTPLVAGVIERHAQHSTEFLPHARLKQGLLNDLHARSIIDKLPQTDQLKTPDAWAGVIVAGFSKEWTEGHWPRFDRKKIGKGHAWRVKSR
jgi:hypothetical protein